MFDIMCIFISLVLVDISILHVTATFVVVYYLLIKFLVRFLTYCKIPFHLPVTIACHNNERCWSSRPDERVFVPYQNYPNLVVV